MSAQPEIINFEEAKNEKQKSKKRGRPKKTSIGMKSTSRSFNYKFYAENIIHLLNNKEYMINGELVRVNRVTLEEAQANDAKAKALGKESREYWDIFDVIKDDLIKALRGFVKKMNLRKGQQFFVILHDKDIITDGIWEAADVKPHFHAIFRNDVPSTVRALLAHTPIIYQKDKDDKLIQNKGIEKTGKLHSSVAYLTHETFQAKEDGKALYLRKDIITNVTDEELEKLFEKNHRSESKKGIVYEENTSVTFLEEEAYKLGQAFGDFKWWWYRSGAIEDMKTRRSKADRDLMQEQYELGVDDKLAEKKSVHRRSIFIFGDAACGKSFSSQVLMQHRYGYRQTHYIDGGGSGKFDKVKGHHKAIIVNDETIKDVLNIADEYPCRAYKRGKDNPVMNNDFLIVTYNEDFLTWVGDLGFDINDKMAGHDFLTQLEIQKKQVKAIATRFAVVEVKKDYLRDEQGRIVLMNYHQNQAFDGTYTLNAQAVKCYQYKILIHNERGSQRAQEYKQREVEEFVANMNALVTRREDKRETVTLTHTDKPIYHHFKNGVLDPNEFVVTGYKNADELIEARFPIDKAIFKTLDEALELEKLKELEENK